MDNASSNWKCDLPEVPFQEFYLFVTAKLLCCNNLKFWLVCEGALSFGKAIIGLQLLFRVIYYDFLAHNVPFKTSVDGNTARKMKVCLENYDGSMEGLLRMAQVNIGHQLLGTSDLRCIYDLVVTICKKNRDEIQKSRHQSAGVRVAANELESASLVNNFTVDKGCSNVPDSTFFQEVSHRLLREQKEREILLKKAQEEVRKEGKDATTVEWYDFSGCKKKYQPNFEFSCTKNLLH